MKETENDLAALRFQIITTVADAPPGRQMFRQIPAIRRFAVPIAGNANAGYIVIKTPGSRVRRGEILVEQWPDSSAAPVAPGDGRIAGLGCAKLSTRQTVPAILFEPASPPSPPEPAQAATPDAIPNLLRWLRDTNLAGGIRQLREMGVWADRWTTPDLLGQLHQCLENPIDTVICNVLDESPDLLVHHELAKAYPVELVAGVLALAQLTKAENVWAVVAAFGDGAGWDALRRAVVGTRLKLVPLQDHYPQAHPTLLIHEITRRHSRPTQLPVQSKVLTIDASAAIAAGKCFLRNEPMISVPVGLHDRRNDETHWLQVPVGMPWSSVLAHLSIDETGMELHAGNPIREVHLTSDCVAGGGEQSITVTAPRRHLNPDPCIRCAWCVQGCPVRIQPAGLLEAAQQDDPYLAEQYGLGACIECGICSYVCPSHLPLLEAIRKLRT